MIAVEVGSFRAVAAAIHALAAPRLAPAAAEGLQEAGIVLHAAIKRNISYRDHSLADLARMGHPYARRHGRIKVHPRRPYVVHTQGGTMLSALHAGLSGSGRYFEVWVDRGAAPHAAFVVGGTRKMLPRNVLWLTAQDGHVRRSMMRAFLRVMGKKWRTQSMVRFQPVVQAGDGLRV